MTRDVDGMHDTWANMQATAMMMLMPVMANLERASRIVGRRFREEPEDLLQELFVRLSSPSVFRGLPSDMGKLLAYCQLTMVRICLDRCRKRARERVAMAGYAAEVSGRCVIPEATEDMLRREAIDRISTLLSPKDQNVLELMFVRGMTYAEVASKLGVSLAAVKGMVWRMMMKLREHEDLCVEVLS